MKKTGNNSSKPTDYLLDAHVHYGALNNIDYSLLQIVKKLKRSGVKQAIISNLSAASVSAHFGNSKLQQDLAKYPDYLRGLWWVNPYDKNWQQDLQQGCRNKQVVGLKLHSGLNSFWIEEKFLAPIFIAAKKYALPICIHTDKRRKMRADRLTPLVRKFPTVKIVLYHSLPFTPALALAIRYPSVYLEISGLPIKQIKKGISKAGAEKVVFGSDFPAGFCGFPSMASKEKVDYNSLLSAYKKNIPPQAQEYFFRLNTEKIFNLV